MDPENKQHQEAADSIVLEEEIDPNYVPSEAEVVEYAKWLGMDLDKDHDLFWIAREGLMAPLPKNWKPCKQKDTEDIYYFNFTSGESTWDHPCDGYYKKQYEEHKKKKEKGLKESGDQKRSKAKQDVDQLLGKKKKGKETKSLDSIPPISAPGGSGGAGLLERKPLPGITMQPRLQLSSPAPLIKENVISDKVLLSGGGDSMFMAKSKASSKLLAAVAGEAADSKQSDRGGGEFKLESKLDSVPLGSTTQSREEGLSSAASARRPSSAPAGGESKDGGHRDITSHLSNDDSRSHGDLAPLFPRSKALPSVGSFGSNPLGRNTHSPVQEGRASSPAPINGSTSVDSLRLQQQLQQVRDDLRREGERCSQLEDDLRILKSRSRDAEGAAAEAQRTADVSVAAIKSDMSSLEFSLRQANNYVADKNAAIDLANAELAQRNQEIQSLTADRGGLQSQLAGLSQEISRLAAELQTKTQEAARLGRELGEARQEGLQDKRSVKEQEELLQLERDKYVRLDDALSKTISSLRQRNSELEVSLSIADKVGGVDSTLHSPNLSAALDAATASLAKEKALVDTLREELARRDDSVSVAASVTEARYATETSRLRTEVAILFASLEERTGELAKATDRMNEIQVDRSRLTETSERTSSVLQASLDAQLTQVELLRSQVADLDSERTALSTRNDQLSSALEVANSIIAATSAISSGNSSSSPSGAVEVSLSAVNASLIAQVSQLNVRICDLEGDLRETRRKCEQLSGALNTAEIAVAEGVLAIGRRTQEELEATTRLLHVSDERDVFAMDLSRLRTDCTILRSELHSVTEALEMEQAQTLQKDKKIRSYQEELLQVQRRIAVPPERDAVLLSVATQTDAEVEVVRQSDTELVSEQRRRDILALDVNSALDELRSVVSDKEQMIAQMSSQLQELRAQLLESRSASQTAVSESVLQREMEAQNAIQEGRKQLDEKDRAIKVLTAKWQLTVDKLASAESEGDSYRAYWQEAEGKLLKLRSSQQQAAHESEGLLSSTQEQVAELQAALSVAKSAAVQSRAECAESQRRLAVLQVERETGPNGAEGLEEEVRSLRAALQIAREALVAQRVALQTSQPVVETASTKLTTGSDKQFESAVTNSIVELSIVVGKQQASVTRLEEQLQLMNAKPINQTPTVHSRITSSKQHAWSSNGLESAGYISSSGGDCTPTESGRSDSTRGGHTRRNVKFEEDHHQQQQQQRGKHRVRASEGRAGDSSSDDLALLSLLRSPTDEGVDGGASDRIEALGRRIESLWRKGASLSDAHSLQTAVQLEVALLGDAEGFLRSVKAGLRSRSSSVASLKALWKAKGQRGASDGFGMSSSLINQQLTSLNNAIKAADELKDCIADRRNSLDGLRDAVKRSASHSKLQTAQRELSSGLHRLLMVVARITDNVNANERNTRRERSLAHEQSFDDSYVPYDRHQIAERHYAEGASRRAAEAPDNYGRFGLRDSRHSGAVSSSLEFPQQSSRSLDQRRLFAQQHIAKIEKRQTDTWKECEDHVNFLAKIRKDLGTVTYSTSDHKKKTDPFSSSLHGVETDRENTGNYNCNMLLSGLEPGRKKSYEI